MPHPSAVISGLPEVIIVMATLNGAQWLEAQLDSIAAQDHADWALWISDDGSSDASLAIIAAFQARHPARNIRLLSGPGVGAAQNFLWLLGHPELPLGAATHLAVSDQDDVWLPQKLARALAVLARQSDAACPLIYGAQSLHIDAAGRRIGRSRRPGRAVCLQNAVVQNMVSGHSLMLNPSALALARRAVQNLAGQEGRGAPLAPIAFHDWWLSLLILASGGRAVVDMTTVLLYRQHDGNVLGAPQGLAAQARRVLLLFGDQYAGWLAANLAALAASRVALTPEAGQIIAALGQRQRGFDRLRQIWRLGIHRQSRFGTALLYLATLLGRV